MYALLRNDNPMTRNSQENTGNFTAGKLYYVIKMKGGQPFVTNDKDRESKPSVNIPGYWTVFNTVWECERHMLVKRVADAALFKPIIDYERCQTFTGIDLGSTRAINSWPRHFGKSMLRNETFIKLNEEDNMSHSTEQQLEITEPTLLNGVDSERFNTNEILCYIEQEQAKLDRLNSFDIKSDALAKLKQGHAENISKLERILEEKVS